jgi:hypothetical protein
MMQGSVISLASCDRTLEARGPFAWPIGLALYRVMRVVAGDLAVWRSIV